MLGLLAHTLPIKELRDTDLVVIGTQENHFKGESAGISKKTSTANILNDIGDAISDGGGGGRRYIRWH